MKLNQLLLVLAFACISVAHAQTEKGTKTLGLSFNYSTEKRDNSDSPGEDKFTFYGIGPTFSYFIADHLDLGASLNYQHSKYKYASQNAFLSSQEAQVYQATVFLRKHIMFFDQFGLRTGPFASFSAGNSDEFFQDGQKRIVNTKEFRGGLNLGIEYFPTKKIGIAANLATLSYSHLREDVDNGRESLDKTNSFNLDVTNGLNLSIFLVLGAK